MNRSDALGLTGTGMLIASVCLFSTGHRIGGTVLLTWLVLLMAFSGKD